MGCFPLPNTFVSHEGLGPACCQEMELKKEPPDVIKSLEGPHPLAPILRQAARCCMRAPLGGV